MTVDTYDYNNVNGVSIENRNNLLIKLNNDGRKAIQVLMMNPSYSDRELSDTTTKYVISSVLDKNDELTGNDKYGQIEIFNVHPQIATDSSNLKEMERYECKYNLQYLYHKMVKSNRDIIFATSDLVNSKAPVNVRHQMIKTYNLLLKKIYKIKDNINLFSYGLTEHNYGFHKSRINANTPLQKTDILFSDDKYHLIV
ncbi:DUF1643 domain-containing protein [Apilactobacillus timberlakei]|uniref:DUF1643 domain-containing protein n=1 Tax=Apilactobacillus timberlakei TaxID=2008380 RepID=UPI001126B753|nr:DUF1643 domain-containing protein [Apilactobacillus timberlakei]TPR13022.1 DUF1643 domain-containing protein [Apilactobacillus timberlakei]